MIMMMIKRIFQPQNLVPAKHKKTLIRKIKLPQKFSTTWVSPIVGTLEW